MEEGIFTYKSQGKLIKLIKINLAVLIVRNKIFTGDLLAFRENKRKLYKQIETTYKKYLLLNLGT